MIVLAVPVPVGLSTPCDGFTGYGVDKLGNCSYLSTPCDGFMGNGWRLGDTFINFQLHVMDSEPWGRYKTRSQGGSFNSM